MMRLYTQKYNAILTEKQQKIPALSSGKIDKYEYLVGKEILHQSRIIKQTKFIYSLLEKGFEKQIKAIEEQGKKQAECLEVF